MGIPGTTFLARDEVHDIYNEDIDPLAFEAYLEGKMLRRTSGRLAGAIAALERAIDIEPSFAAAHAELSFSRMGGPSAEYQYYSDSEISRKAAQRALELDPQSPIAYLVAGRVALMLDWDLTGAEAMFEKALLFEPNNDDLLVYRGYLSKIRGEFDTAIDMARHYTVDNSSNAAAHTNLGQNYYVAGRYREAINSYRWALKLDPGIEFVHVAIGRIRALQGDPVEALHQMELETSSRFQPYGLVIAYAGAGDDTAADKALDEFTAECTQKCPYWISTLHAYRGEIDSAFEYLELAYSQHDIGLLEIMVEPLLNGLRNDPRYAELLSRLRFE